MGFLLQHVAVLFALGVPFLLVFWVLPLWFVCKKAGFSPWLTLLNCIPLGNTVLLYLLAFADWKRHPMFQVDPMPAPQAAQLAQAAQSMQPAQGSKSIQAAAQAAQSGRPHIVARRLEP